MAQMMFENGVNSDPAAAFIESQDESKHPRYLRYKTEICRNYKERSVCIYGDQCQFAHGKRELREVQRNTKYKTKKCLKYWTEGYCAYGSRCNFLHNDDTIIESDVSSSKFSTASDQIVSRSSLNQLHRASSDSNHIFPNHVLSQQHQVFQENASDQPSSSMVDNPEARGLVENAAAMAYNDNELQMAAAVGALPFMRIPSAVPSNFWGMKGEVMSEGGPFWNENEAGVYQITQHPATANGVMGGPSAGVGNFPSNIFSFGPAQHQQPQHLSVPPHPFFNPPRPDPYVQFPDCWSPLFYDDMISTT